MGASAVRWEGKGRGHRVVFGQIHHESPAWSNVVDVSRKHWSPHVRPSEEHRPTTIAHVRGGQIAQNRSLRRTQTLVCIVPTVTVHVSVGRIARAVTVQVTRHARVEQSIGAAGAFVEVRPAVVVVIEVLGQRRRAGVGQSIGPTVSIGVFRGTCVPWERILMIQHAVVVVVVVPEVLDAVAVRVWVAQIEVNRAVHHRVRSRVGGVRDLTVEAAYLRCANAEHLCVHAKEAGPVHVLNATTKGRGFDAAIVAVGGRVGADTAHHIVMIQRQASRFQDRHGLDVAVLHEFQRPSQNVLFRERTLIPNQDVVDALSIGHRMHICDHRTV